MPRECVDCTHRGGIVIIEGVPELPELCFHVVSAFLFFSPPFIIEIYEINMLMT